MPLPETAEEVRRLLAEYAPPVLDRFRGGSSIGPKHSAWSPRAHAADHNPVAMLIIKTLTERRGRADGRPTA